LGLGERTVGGEGLAVAHPDGRGVGGRPQALAAPQDPLLAHLLAPRAVRGEAFAGFLGADGELAVLVGADHQQVPHWVLLGGVSVAPTTNGIARDRHPPPLLPELASQNRTTAGF